MAEALTDDELVTIVDEYKRKRLKRTGSQTADDRHHRYVRELSFCCTIFHCGSEGCWACRPVVAVLCNLFVWSARHAHSLSLSLSLAHTHTHTHTHTHKHTHNTHCRVYVNRSVSMERIKYIGFDMDYTLVGGFSH